LNGIAKHGKLQKPLAEMLEVFLYL